MVTPTFYLDLPSPASEDDCSGRSHLTPSDETRIYLIRAGGLFLNGVPDPSLGLRGLAPSSQSVGLGWLPLFQSDFCDFREHGPRMRIDDLDAPYGEIVARAPTSVFSRGSSRILTSSMQAASDLAASVFVMPVAPSLAPAGVGQKYIFLAPAQPLAPWPVRAPVRTLSPSPPRLRHPI